MNTVSVVEDKIILNWDGVVPQGINPGAIHHPSDMLHFWKHLKGHVAWSKRYAAFSLHFSKQNLKRIHAQFGEIRILAGGDKVTELKQKQSELYEVAQLAKKIKDLPDDRLPVYDYKLPPLAAYQHRGVVFLCNARKAPLFADCGMGKTYMVLNSIQRHKDLNVIPKCKTLIIVKIATMETGWLEDAVKFTDLKLVNLWVSSKNRKRKEIIKQRMTEEADAYLINHEGIRYFTDELAAMDFKKIIIDESTILKNYHGGRKGTAFGNAIQKIAKDAEWKVIMSGTPAPNGPDNLWGQFAFLDPDGLILEPNFHDFQQQHFQLLDLRSKANRTRPLGPRDPKKWIPTNKTIEEVKLLVDPFCYRVRMQDHLKDMPELYPMKRYVEMSAEQDACYLDMKNNLRVVINDERITAQVKITQLMKLRQITGGFIIDHKDEAHSLDSNPKLEELDSLLREEIDQEHKVVIYAQYRWEIKTLENRYKDLGIVTVYGGNDSDKNLKHIKMFREDPKVRVIVLHPKSAAHGITFTIAHYMIFYSIDHSAEDNYQCIHRIKRAGQKHVMFVYYLLAKNSIDDLIYKIIIKKNKDQQSLIDEDQTLLDVFTEDSYELESKGPDI